jgi:hypothetical protein
VQQGHPNTQLPPSQLVNWDEKDPFSSTRYEEVRESNIDESQGEDERPASGGGAPTFAHGPSSPGTAERPDTWSTRRSKKI